MAVGNNGTVSQIHILWGSRLLLPLFRCVQLLRQYEYEVIMSQILHYSVCISKISALVAAAYIISRSYHDLSTALDNSPMADDSEQQGVPPILANSCLV